MSSRQYQKPSHRFTPSAYALQRVAGRPSLLARLEGAQREASLAVRSDSSSDPQPQLNLLLAELYAPLLRDAYNRLLAYPDAVEIAEDVTQNTLFHLAARVRECRARSDAGVALWARVAARRTLVDMLRTPASGLVLRAGAEALQWDQATISFQESAGLREDSSPVVEALLVLAWECYAALDDELAMIFFDRIVGNQTWPEIGARRGLTAGAVKRRFQRGCESLARSVLARVLGVEENTCRAVMQWLAEREYLL